MKVKSSQEIAVFLKDIAESVGVVIDNVEIKHGKNPSITVFIDKEGGVDLDTCEKFHRAIDEPLDAFDPTFGEAYTLNVSSLGADRPFKTEKDFTSHIGKKVEVKLYAAIKGKKFLEGTLLSYDGARIVLDADVKGAKSDKNVLSIELKSVVKINEYIEV